MTSNGVHENPSPSVTANTDSYHDADAHPHQPQSGTNGNDNGGSSNSSTDGMLPSAAIPPPTSVAVAIKALSDHHRAPGLHDHAEMANSPYSMSHPSTAPGSPRL